MADNKGQARRRPTPSVTFNPDPETYAYLEQAAVSEAGGNKSQVIRAALAERMHRSGREGHSVTLSGDLMDTVRRAARLLETTPDALVADIVFGQIERLIEQGLSRREKIRQARARADQADDGPPPEHRPPPAGEKNPKEK